MINPASDITLDDFDVEANLVLTPLLDCAEAYKKDPENFDPVTNQSCVDIAKIYSTGLFHMPKDIKMKLPHLKFYNTIVRETGSIKYQLKYADLIPSAIVPSAYRKYVQNSFVTNRILQASNNISSFKKSNKKLAKAKKEEGKPTLKKATKIKKPKNKN